MMKYIHYFNLIIQSITHSVGYFIFLFLLAELVSFILISTFRLRSNVTRELRRNTLINPFFKKSDSYSVQDTWRQQYHKEIDELFSNSDGALNRWQPLGQWSSPRYHGKFVNIDKYNLRRTIVPTENHYAPDNKIRICFFGGSLVWGWEVRDESTIPSKLLSLRNDAVIENHGQLGYVGSQSIVAFIQRIKYEPKPDVVIFIDGLNEIYSAYQSGVAGIEQNAISRKQRHASKETENIFEFYRKKSSLIKLVFSILKIKKLEDNLSFRDKNESLAHAIIAAYNQNVMLIDKIASAYNIKALFIWHPTIFDKPNLTEYERKVFGMFNFCELLYSSVKKFININNSLAPQVSNLSDVFCRNREPLFVDPWHYNERANYLIAEKINELITSKLHLAR